MKKLISLFLMIITAAFSNVSGEQPLPKEATYHIYVHGKYAGSNQFTIKEEKGSITFESSVQLHYEDFHLDLSSLTEADSATFRTKRYTYQGTQTGKQVSGHFSVQEDTIIGTTKIDENEYSYNAKPLASKAYALQDYHMEHQILLGRAFVASDKYAMQYATFFPLNTMFLSAKVFFESEREVPVGEKSIVCKKLAIHVQNSAPVFSFIDPARNLPIYVVFPSSKTEAFLESCFGERPASFYEKPEETPETPKE